MSPKRFLILPAVALLLFLGVYTWNQRTAVPDTVALNTGLETSAGILKTIGGMYTSVADIWNRYLNLVGVREENEQLKQRLAEVEARLEFAQEERAELIRLREQLQLIPPEHWETLGCRILGRRLGPNSPLLSITLDRDYLTGSTPETPVMTPSSLAGIVLRSGPYTSTALLITDPGVRIAVITQKSRIQGILSGRGEFHPLELDYIPNNAEVEADEIIVTSGMDNIYPKGIPVARISSVNTSEVEAFLTIQATPLADLSKLEEVQILVRKPSAFTPSLPKKHSGNAAEGK